MALLNIFHILALVSFSLCFTIVFTSEYVPVYMWDTLKSDSPLPALGHINEGDFKHILLDKLEHKNTVVLVFAEESLSPEDLRSHDSAGNHVFAALSNIKHKAQTNYYPYVETPLNVLKSLDGISITEISNDLSGKIDVKPGEILIVDLNDAKENEDRNHMLSRHDFDVSSIYKKVAAKHENVLAIFTGRHSAWLVPSEVEGNSRQARHLLQNSEMPANYVLVNTSKVLLYASEPILYVKSNKYVITNCSASSSFNDTIDLCANNEEYTLNFKFIESRGYWYLGIVNVSNKMVSYNKTFTNIYAPDSFSYFCNSSNFTIAEDVHLELPALQIQAFSEDDGENDQFSSAYDCVGFTTAPIWSGLFVTFILAMIMTFGLCMIMDIKTMDRFDDPKGKTISINVTE